VSRPRPGQYKIFLEQQREKDEKERKLFALIDKFLMVGTRKRKGKLRVYRRHRS